MKMRLTPPVAAPGAWLIAGRSAAGAVLLAVTVSACSGGGSSVPSISAPTPQTNGQSSSHQGTRTPSPAGQASRSGRSTASSSASTSAPGRGGASVSESPPAAASSSASSHASSSATAKPSHTGTPAPSHSSAPATPAFPTAAPETGGGGTAGLQDGLLFGVGGLAVFAGFGTLVYRRRLARKFGINEPTRRDQADRESADR
jgi:hypothetical protein